MFKKNLSKAVAVLLFILLFSVPLLIHAQEYESRLRDEEFSNEIYVADYMARRFNRTVEIAVEADNHFINVANIAIFHMYSIMETMTGSRMCNINRTVYPFLGGFNVDEIIPIACSDGVLFAYAVNLKSNCAVFAYVIIGTRSDMPPIIEFSLGERYDAMKYCYYGFVDANMNYVNWS